MWWEKVVNPILFKQISQPHIFNFPSTVSYFSIAYNFILWCNYFQRNLEISYNISTSIFFLAKSYAHLYSQDVSAIKHHSLASVNPSETLWLIVTNVISGGFQMWHLHLWPCQCISMQDVICWCFTNIHIGTLLITIVWNPPVIVIFNRDTLLVL